MSDRSIKPMSDPKLPGLARATDDAGMRDVLSVILNHGGPAPARVRHELLKHTPGKRCVIAYRLESDGHAEGARVIGKLYRGDRGARIFERLQRLHQASRENGAEAAAFGMPAPLAYVPELGMVLQSALTGTPLSRMEVDGDWAGAMRAVADNLAALHALPASLGEPRSVADHVRKLCRPAPEALIEERPEFAPWVESIAGALRAVDAAPAGEPCLVHGDLGLSQVFVADSRACFIDFDGLCQSRAALDVGNFLVSLRVRLGSASLEPERVLVERYLERRPPEALGHLHAFQTLAYLRRAMICFRTKASPDWGAKLERLLKLACWVGRADSDVQTPFEG